METVTTILFQFALDCHSDHPILSVFILRIKVLLWQNAICYFHSSRNCLI